jgi:hypothetical protein
MGRFDRWQKRAAKHEQYGRMSDDMTTRIPFERWKKNNTTWLQIFYVQLLNRSQNYKQISRMWNTSRNVLHKSI